MWEGGKASHTDICSVFVEEIPVLAVDQLLQVLTARNGGLQFLLHLRQRFVLLRNGLLHLSITKKERKKERKRGNERVAFWFLSQAIKRLPSLSIFTAGWRC